MVLCQEGFSVGGAVSSCGLLAQYQNIDGISSIVSVVGM